MFCGTESCAGREVARMTLPLDQQAFEAHLQDAGYIIGVNKKKWKLAKKLWPDSIFEVKAKCGKWWAISINFNGYPEEAPKGMFWSIAENRPLENSTETPNAIPINEDDDVYLSFSTQSHGIYAPFDRLRKSNTGYNDTHLYQCWQPSKKINFYLENIYELLNSRNYRPPENG